MRSAVLCVGSQAYYQTLIGKAQQIDLLAGEFDRVKLELEEKKRRFDDLRAQLSVAEVELKRLHDRGPPLSFSSLSSSALSSFPPVLSLPGGIPLIAQAISHAPSSSSVAVAASAAVAAATHAASADADMGRRRHGGLNGDASGGMGGGSFVSVPIAAGWSSGGGSSSRAAVSGLGASVPLSTLT